MGLRPRRRAGADEGHRRDRARALRHQGQVAGRAGLRPARRAVPRADPAVLDAFRVVPGDRRPRRWASSRRGRWTPGSRSSTTWRRPGSGRSRRTCSCPGLATGPAADARRRDRPVADRRGGRRSSARCATGSGPAMGILFDVGQEYRHGGIVQLAQALEPFDLYWLEAEGFDPDALLAARRQTRTRICHGEALIRREAFRPFFERHVTDVVMVETLTNGLSEARRICDLAAHYDTMFSPAQLHEPARHAHQRAPVRRDAELRDPRDRHGRRALEVGPHRPDARHRGRRAPRAVAAGARREHRRGGRRRAPVATRETDVDAALAGRRTLP